MWCARRKLRTFPLMGLRHAERIGEVAMKAKTILEYGSGGSTLWLAQIAPEAAIVSVEHDPKWYARVRNTYEALRQVGVISEDKVYWVHTQSLVHYAKGSRIGWGAATFDMILIDGIHETRDACLRGAFDLLNPGGTVFLHDAEEPDYYAGKCAFVAAGGSGQVCLLFDPSQRGDIQGRCTWDPTYDTDAQLWMGKKPC